MGFVGSSGFGSEVDKLSLNTAQELSYTDCFVEHQIADNMLNNKQATTSRKRVKRYR